MAIASMEHEAGGSRKSVKKFLRQSLQDPTENAIAQAEWLTSRDHNLGYVKASSFDVVGNFEATARESFFAGDWEKSLASSIDWLGDQAFSARPAIMTTFIASTPLDDPETAIKFGAESIVASPNDATLLNNLAFAHATLGQTAEARKYLNDALKQGLRIDELIVLAATEGLISFREGAIERGRDLYAKAMEIASKDKENSRFVEMSRVYLAREEIRARTSETTHATRLLESIAKNSNNRLAKHVAALVLKNLGLARSAV